MDCQNNQMVNEVSCVGGWCQRSLRGSNDENEVDCMEGRRGLRLLSLARDEDSCCVDKSMRIGWVWSYINIMLIGGYCKTKPTLFRRPCD